MGSRKTKQNKKQTKKPKEKKKKTLGSGEKKKKQLRTISYHPLGCNVHPSTEAYIED